MLKALLAVDGADHSLGVARHANKLVRDRDPLEFA
jgi:hypothetical protein